MRTTLFVILISMILTGCKFSRSVEKDLASGLTSTGSDLSCEDVYITIDDEKTTRNTFVYGETFYICFDDIKGFAVENGNVFPGMEIVITDPEGNTLMSADDLYEEYTEGMNYSPLQLTADLTVANPIKSKGEYTLTINIRDKKGNGTFRSEFDFSVVENDKIAVQAKDVSCDEVYLFSQGQNRVITDNAINSDDNIYLIVEGLKGFG